MTNARSELQQKLEGKAPMKCAIVQREINWDDLDTIAFLREGYNGVDLDLFLDKLDFEYDSSYGGQILYGNVWLEDGTWLERGEYDGSEWWEHKVCPEIPKLLK
jgi:hypothetical protein